MAFAAAFASLAVAPAAVSGGNSGFFIGFADDLPKQVGADAVTPATELGASAFRFTLQWTPGQTQLSAADTAGLDRAVGAATGSRIVLAVYGTTADAAPTDATRRDQYCTYVKSAVARYSQVRDVVIWNEPNKSLFWKPQLNADGSTASPAAYEAVIAQCYDVLHAAFPNVNVIGLALSSTGNDDAGSQSPGNFIRKVGEAYRTSGRSAPILDTVALHPYPSKPSERPWAQHIASKVIGQGDWNKLMYNLWLAFSGTGQPIPGAGVSIWYLEDGFQSQIPAEKASLYTGTENVAALPEWTGGEPDAPTPAATSPAPDAGTQVLDAVRLAACQPNVAAYFNFLLADEPVLTGWQSGPLYADRTRKASYPAFQQAFAAAAGGTVDCAALKGGLPSPDFMPPTIPANLAGAAATGPLRVDLTWEASADDASAITYRIYRNGTWVGTTSTTAWSNVAVSDATRYTYTVRALDAAGNLGDASNAVVVTTPDLTAPSAPTALAATAGSNPGRIDMTWTAATDNVGVASYEVSRDGVAIASASVPAFTDTNVGSVTTYTYVVVALDAAGNRSAGATVTVTTGDLVAPTAPASVTARPYDGPPHVDLTWPSATDDVGVTAYDVLRDGAVVATIAATSWTDTAVAATQTHSYGVRARDAAGNVSAATTVSVTVPDLLAPSRPGSFAVSAYSRPARVGLSWTPATDNVRVTGYEIYRNGTFLTTVTASTFVDTAVRATTTYRYAVAAVDAAGNLGPATATLQVTTPRK
ncbi:MAG: fibronectin type III domain-containing protein [Gaiellaceae bacterium]